MGMCKHCGKTTYLTHLHSCDIKPKEWQGLSNEEIAEFVLEEFGKNLSELLVFQAVDIIPVILKLEQKLKDKNS